MAKLTSKTTDVYECTPETNASINLGYQLATEQDRAKKRQRGSVGQEGRGENRIE